MNKFATLLRLLGASLVFAQLSTALSSPSLQSYALGKPLDTPESEGEAANNDPNRKFCTIFRKLTQYSYDGKTTTRWDMWNPDQSRKDCIDACPVKHDNSIHSSTCGWTGGANYDWVDTNQPGIQNALAPCVCDSALIDELVGDFVKSLPAIAEAACEVWVGALTGFVDFFIDAVIDTLEQAIDAAENLGAVDGNKKFFALNAGHQDVIQAALLMNQTYSTLEKGRDAFGKFIASKVCPQGALSKEQSSQIFGAINQVNWLVVSAVTLPEGAGAVADAFRLLQTPKWARGLDPPDSALPKAPGTPLKTPPKPIKPSPKPRTDSPKKTSERPQTTRAPTSHAPEKTDPARQCRKTKDKRGNDPKKQNKCDDDKKTIYRVVQSVSELHTVEKLCDGKKYTQACAHYSSAAAVAGRKGTFTCSDSFPKGRGKDLPAMDLWDEEHKNEKWRKFTKAEYQFNGKNAGPRAPNCQRDEWPPAYFVPRDKRDSPEWGQQIRWLPGSENEGVSGLWLSFCAKNDGGQGNNQRIAQEGFSGEELKLNKDLMSWQDSDVHSEENKGDDHTTTVTSIFKKVTYSRAVFTMKYDFHEWPTKENEYLLNANPCWPEDIVPGDPGYALLINDPWYDNSKTGKKVKLGQRESYAKNPSDELLQDAEKRKERRLANTGNKRPPSPDDPADSKQPPAQQPKSGGSKNSRRLVVDENGQLLVRDDSMNVTRPLTDEERKRDLQVIPCRDRKCTQEARDVEDDDDAGVVIPGAGPPSVPSANYAIPTFVTRTKVETPGLKRRSPSDDTLPVATITPP